LIKLIGFVGIVELIKKPKRYIAILANALVLWVS